MALLENRLTLMQRLQDAARHGYHHFAIGQVSRPKWPALALKFSKNYDADLPKSTRSKRRKAGEAVTLVYAAEPPPFEQNAPIVFALLVTDGAGRIHVREELKDMREKGCRLELDGYELVHDGKCWTWRMTQKRYLYWRERIHAAAAKPVDKRKEMYPVGELARDEDAEKILDALYNQPGFRLVRRQVGQLVHFLLGEWMRLRKDSLAQPQARAFLPYVTRLPNSGRVIRKPKEVVDLTLQVTPE